jgi:hypothetical protein
VSTRNFDERKGSLYEADTELKTILQSWDDEIDELNRIRISEVVLMQQFQIGALLLALELS